MDETKMSLSDLEKQRYARQMMLENVGGEGQEKIAASNVLVIGAGGLGSAIIYYLAAAGVGNLGVVDFDKVDLSNLQRQILHATPDVDVLKVESAKESVERLNPHINVTPIELKLTLDNIDKVIKPYDIIVDAVDSFGAKYLINDACVKAGKKLVHGGATGYTGQVLTYSPGTTCLRCIFPELPKSMEAPAGLGIIGAVAGVIGTMQSVEVIKLILKVGTSSTNSLLSFDGLSLRTVSMKVTPSDSCPVCG